MKTARRLLLSLLYLAAALLLPACSEPTEGEAPREEALLGVLTVHAGNQLQRDILPQLADLYDITLEDAEAAASAVRDSSLIAPDLQGPRRLEGILRPGEYEVPEGLPLETLFESFLEEAELRYQRLFKTVENPNSLSPYQVLILASIIEAECLGGEFHKETAAVFLNRLEAGMKLQSCVTAEYALGYARPYLTGEDVSLSSPWNTYYAQGLPPSPICVAGEESLSAAMGVSQDPALLYFYYDYLLGEMFFFSDYLEFQEAGASSRDAFLKKSPVGLRDKISKDDLYRP